MPYSEFEKEYLGSRGSFEKSTSSNTLSELPEKWYIKPNKDVLKWFSENRTDGINDYAIHNSYLSYTAICYPAAKGIHNWQHHAHMDGAVKHLISEGYKEITFDQFKKWVLKEGEKKETTPLDSNKPFAPLDTTKPSSPPAEPWEPKVGEYAVIINGIGWGIDSANNGGIARIDKIGRWFRRTAISGTFINPRPNSSASFIDVPLLTDEGQIICRKALPHEIPTTPTGMLTPYGKEQLLEEAKRRFPPGTKFYPAHLHPYKDGICTVTKEQVPHFESGKDDVIQFSTGDRYKNGHAYSEVIYVKGRWAEIVEPAIPESNGLGASQEFSVGDWVTLTEDYCNGALKAGETYKILKPQFANDDNYWVLEHQPRGSYLAPNKKILRKAAPTGTNLSKSYLDGLKSGMLEALEPRQYIAGTDPFSGNGWKQESMTQQQIEQLYGIKFTEPVEITYGGKNGVLNFKKYLPITQPSNKITVKSHEEFKLTISKPKQIKI
jgi:hypothetical protein